VFALAAPGGGACARCARGSLACNLALLLLHPGTEATRVELGLWRRAAMPVICSSCSREQLARVTLPRGEALAVARTETGRALAAASLDLFGSRQADARPAGVLIERLRARSVGVGARPQEWSPNIARNGPRLDVAGRGWDFFLRSDRVPSGRSGCCQSPLPLEMRDGQPCSAAPWNSRTTSSASKAAGGRHRHRARLFRRAQRPGRALLGIRICRRHGSGGCMECLGEDWVLVMLQERRPRRDILAPLPP